MSAVSAFPGAWPADARMAGHGPGCCERTVKTPPQAIAGKQRTKTTLPGERIPYPYANIGEIRPPRIVRVDQINAAYRAGCDRRCFRKPLRPEPHTGSDLR